jgi:hypothetical protein
MTDLKQTAINKLKTCIKAMLEAEKALRPLHPDKADEIKGAAGIASEWVEHISGDAE